MKLLITGAFGQIGSLLFRDLKPGDFFEVAVVNNFGMQRSRLAMQ